MSRAYYNDFDADVCAVLRELIKRGLIPDGEVDGRSILDVDPADLKGFVQCHFFAGVGGWGYALRLAGWPDDKPVWTGSPPCQPFSVAGKGLAADDPRHLGPAFVRLVRSARPGVLFGEQVASADVFGHVAGGRKRGVAGQPQWTWIDDLFLRLEAARYAAWAVDYPSASIGAPHIRQRTYFGAVGLADAEHAVRRSVCQHGEDGRDWSDGGWPETHGVSGTCGEVHRLADAASRGLGEFGDAAQPGRGRHADGGCGASGGLADANGRNTGAERQQRGGEHRFEQADGDADPEPAAGPTYGPWGDADWLYSRDGRWRPVEARTQPMVDGVPARVGHSGDLSGADSPQEKAIRLALEEIGFPLGHKSPARVGRLRGYGNAINPHQAAHFIRTTYHG